MHKGVVADFIKNIFLYTEASLLDCCNEVFCSHEDNVQYPGEPSIGA